MVIVIIVEIEVVTPRMQPFLKSCMAARCGCSLRARAHVRALMVACVRGHVSVNIGCLIAAPNSNNNTTINDDTSNNDSNSNNNDDNLSLSLSLSIYTYT